MKWPWVSRKRYDKILSDLLAANDVLNRARVDMCGKFGELLSVETRVEILAFDLRQRCEQVEELQQLHDELDVALGPAGRWDTDARGNTLSLSQRCERLKALVAKAEANA